MTEKKTANGNGNAMTPICPGQAFTIVTTNVLVHGSYGGCDAAGRPILNMRTESRFCERVAAAVGQRN